MLQSTSSHFVSSNFGNQFINSPNASLIGTISENADAEINSLLDIQIQQDVPHIDQEPFHSVKVSVILETTQKPPSTPPTPLLRATEILSTQELKQADHSTFILASIKSYLGSSLLDALKKFLPQVVKESLEKTPHSLGETYSQGQSAIQAVESLSEYELKKILYEKMHKSQSHLTHDAHQELYDSLTWSMLLDKATTKKGDNPDKVLKKRDHGDDQDEDPSTGSNQGKKTKKRKVNESESRKKTSTTKESSKGKFPARTSKSGKSVIAKESIEEQVFEIASNDVEQTVDDKVGDAGQPPYTDADETQADAALKIPKKDWFKKATRPETLDPD
ncbi:hypothetical protein Tco_0230872 [Tanacetum coccineum]